MWRTVRDVLLIIFFTLLFAAGIKSCVIDAFKIPTDSMSETLRAGDFLLVNKFIYGARTPGKFFSLQIPSFTFPALTAAARGDVVVFKFPGEPDEIIPPPDQFLVKRIVALPGDTVEIANANLIVNGFRAEHSYSQFDAAPFSAVVPFKGMAIPLDSSALHRWSVFIRREGHRIDSEGNSVLIDGASSSLYIVQKNYFFVVGDNAKNSYDSRHWGFLPEENVIGRAMIAYWSKDENGIRWDRIGTVVR